MKNKKKQAKRVAVGFMSAAMAMSAVCVPAMAADDMTEPNPVIEEHPDDTMSPTVIVTPIGKHTFYKIVGDHIEYADRDNGDTTDSGERVWNAVPSAYILDSGYNIGNVAYGMYVTTNGKVHYVDLNACHKDATGDNYTWYHGTSDSATVSSDVDTATNDDPTMGTQFYINVENGIDPDGTTTDETKNALTADPRVDYDITVTTKSTYQLKATVPMYVCMYGYRGTGNVVTPSKDAYQLKNYSTESQNSSATVTDITKITHYAKIYDENHSDERLFSIAYDEVAKTYTYWYSDPSTAADWKEPANYHVMTADENINASGQVYVIFIDGQWSFKAAGVLDGDALRETVKAVDPNHELAADFTVGEFNFNKQPQIGQSATGGKDQGLALKVTEIQAEPATWKLVSDTKSDNLKRGEMVMSIAPSKAITDSSALDMSTLSASTDITERGWFLEAPTVDDKGKVSEDAATKLPMITKAKIAGGNVNPAGCTSVVKVTYTLTPMFGIDDGETNTKTADSVDHNEVNEANP